MTQYSLSLRGEEWTDNEKLVDWECSKCGARFATKDDAVAHVRLEHGGGTVHPRLNAIGVQLVVMSLRLNTGQDTFGMAFDRRSGVLRPESFSGSMSQQQALNIIKEEEPKILSMMGMKSEVVEATALAGDLPRTVGFQESAGTTEKTIGDLLAEDNEKHPLGTWLYWAAQVIWQQDPPNLAIIIMKNAHQIAADGKRKTFIDEKLSRCANAEDYREAALDVATPFALSFLKRYPTLAEAQSRFSRLLSLREMVGGDLAKQLADAKQILNLTIDEAQTLLAARPLVHDFQDKMAMQQLSDSTLPPAPPVDTAALRQRLQRLDSVEIESLCLDNFSMVYDQFSRGLQRGEMINLLLDHCRRNPEDAARLADVVLSPRFPNRAPAGCAK